MITTLHWSIQGVMRPSPARAFVSAWAIAALACTNPERGSGEQRPVPALPLPITNNAVVGTTTSRGATLFSFLGLGASKEHDAITNRAFRWTVGDTAWTEIPPVPGPPRIAATASGIGNMHDLTCRQIRCYEEKLRAGGVR